MQNLKPPEIYNFEISFRYTVLANLVGFFKALKLGGNACY